MMATLNPVRSVQLIAAIHMNRPTDVIPSTTISVIAARSCGDAFFDAIMWAQWNYYQNLSEAKDPIACNGTATI